jgi:hypothetical protein
LPIDQRSIEGFDFESFFYLNKGLIPVEDVEYLKKRWCVLNPDARNLEEPEEE